MDEFELLDVEHVGFGAKLRVMRRKAAMLSHAEPGKLRAMGTAAPALLFSAILLSLPAFTDRSYSPAQLIRQRHASLPPMRRLYWRAACFMHVRVSRRSGGFMKC
ncbi:hypothetical protein E6C76_01465 [Pseudothauera nasutitermitis]|uniref:Uncharacterized protein n=1 Tax=Pseudothauera nasutitermitis TaxID=2565930 RepID=A0A4V6RXA0_9RHOO|nr:hypothetical protein [Pseudothauera nasutitermitis]THF67084.1 hypothetical protein E6C76_01465 [Pseudothauera nasutitermitis]